MGYSNNKLDNMFTDEFQINDILSTIDKLYELEKKSSDTGKEKINEEHHIFEITEEEMKKNGFSEGQIQEVMLGLEQNLPVKEYAKGCYNWKQMHQIRLGLLENIDVTTYENNLYSAEQMNEIRLGLVDQLDVSSYAKLMYSATDMSNKRKKLLSKLYMENPKSFGKETVDEESSIHIRISEDCLEAYINIPVPAEEYTPYYLKKVLMRNGVVHGINMGILKRIIENKEFDKEILVAKGETASRGKDGKYEYFFNKLLPESPKIYDNGNVDYTEVIVADKVKKGDVLVRYHNSTIGKSGETVTGIILEGERGRDLPPFVGVGFIRDNENNTYTAITDGYVSLDEVQSCLNVWNVFVVEGNINRYNGNITYDGTIHIKGSVQDMAVITATGDVVIDGYIEAAEINAGGNVILKKGANADGKGFIHAGGRVMGNFFEYTNIDARGRVEANYFLDCNVSTDNVVIARGNRARIMGGRIKAAKGVESITIGNYGRKTTIIDVGDISWIEKRMHKYREKLEYVIRELIQLKSGRDKLSNMLGEDVLQGNNLFKKICIAIQMKEEQQTAFEREIQYFEDLRRNAARAYVKAYGGIQEDVIIIRNGVRKNIQKHNKR